MSRYRSARGADVLFPMGWDAFGLPAENAAMQRHITPEAWTQQNIASMRAQLDRLELSFDWERELQTCDSSYYGRTQALFLRFLSSGLAYRKSATVNWDPVDKTVLANEQVDAAGKSWRSGAVVEQKELEQWFFRITNYADRLLDDMRLLDWPEKILNLQRNWIAKSAGHLVPFVLTKGDDAQTVFAFTTRVETLQGVSFLGFSEKKYAELGLTSEWVATHPQTGEALPIACDEYVLNDVGTGVVMGVPAYDERDETLAETHGFPRIDFELPEAEEDLVALRTQIAAALGLETATNYKLRDWLVSRQRRWGTPIPTVHCESCGEVTPLTEDDLPVPVSPPDKESTAFAAWSKDPSLPTCGSCGSPETFRDPDTLDTFVDSSWYWLAFAQGESRWFKSERGLATYVGGVEHSILHLLYARFFAKAMHDLDLCDVVEPFERFVPIGLVLGKTAKRIGSGEYVAEGVDVVDSAQVEFTWEKMSKSKRNGVNPNELIERFGADATRVSTLFAGAIEKEIKFDPTAINGSVRFLRRVENHVRACKDIELEESASHALTDPGLCALVADVESSIERLHLNVSVSNLMKFSNALDKNALGDLEYARGVFSLMRMLTPFAPVAGSSPTSLEESPASWRTVSWPDTDPRVAVQQKAQKTKVIVQLDGKTRHLLEIDPSGEGSNDSFVADLALSKLTGGGKNGNFDLEKLTSKAPVVRRLGGKIVVDVRT